jgi:hypothetical protein
MKNTLFIPLVAGLLLISSVLPAVQAAAWSGNPGEIIFAAIISPYPGYQLKAQDYIQNGNLYKADCEATTSQYNERLRSYVLAEAALQKTPVDMTTLKNPTPQQRSYVMSTGFHTKDPTAAGLYEKMISSCNQAEKYYNKAFEMTADDNYEQQAQIFDAGSGIYENMGMRSEAQQTKDAAGVARAHAAARSFFLPLPVWAALFGVIGGLFLLRRKKR